MNKFTKYFESSAQGFTFEMSKLPMVCIFIQEPNDDKGQFSKLIMEKLAIGTDKDNSFVRRLAVFESNLPIFQKPVQISYRHTPQSRRTYNALAYPFLELPVVGT